MSVFDGEVTSTKLGQPLPIWAEGMYMRPAITRSTCARWPSSWMTRSRASPVHGAFFYDPWRSGDSSPWFGDPAIVTLGVTACTRPRSASGTRKIMFRPTLPRCP